MLKNIKSKGSQPLPGGKKGLTFTRLAVAVTLSLFAHHGYAEDFFNVNALEIDNPTATPVDLAQFASQGGQAPGTYHVDVYMNGEHQDTLDVTFVDGDNGKLQPLLTPTQLAKWGMVLSSVPGMAVMAKDKATNSLTKIIPQAKTDFDLPHLALKISVPQDNMNQTAQGEVDPQLWDDGITALLLSYSFSGANTQQISNGAVTTNDFLNLHSGFNLGGWRLRNYSTWNYSKSSGTSNGETDEPAESHWNSINTFIQHDLKRLRGQFTAGDSYTPSDVFDSLQFRGAQIASDDDMLPESLKGFAPTIRGIANSNARVTVKQNGSVIYQRYVSPGAFTLSDLYPTSSSGDLQVTIREADGSERSFVQPFSNVPIMQRQGRLKYTVTAGKYRASNPDGVAPVFGQVTLLYGLPHDVTVYGGVQTAANYRSAALGFGFGLGDLGSVSIDLTNAWTGAGQDADAQAAKEGQSFRFQYSKDITATDSTITLAGYRYSTKGFYTFSEAAQYQSATDDNNSSDIHNNKRSKMQIDLTQNLMGGDWGSLSLSGYQQDYWDEEGYERNLSVGYSNSWNGISWTLMYTQTSYANSDQGSNQQLALNLSIPLSRWLPNTYVSTSSTHDSHGGSVNQVGLSGTALKNNNLSYSVMQGYGSNGDGYNGMMSADYRGSYGEVNAGYNYNDSSRQLNYGAQGSMIVHSHGVTFGQPLSGDISSIALVAAPGADNALVQNSTGVRTDWRGYTIVPYLSPYRRDRVALDTESLGNNVDLKGNVASVVPTKGAVVLAKFQTSVGSRVLLNLIHSGQAVPFGATVTLDSKDDMTEENASIVGEEGQVYLSGVPEKGSLTAKWGDGGTQQCRANFELPPVRENNKVGIEQLNLICH
ncbi:MAG TPA: fimbria/pilus outer membrane usher protein [Scandinavium sp.]|jgi:outer membrane usher protein|uniref:fimbria/pilus outer membrane usher protein n=1 Tax=Scandinavium sp. TaxID=2830653 RepID=UPI002E2EC1E5|nr:fimbria/pilus outer membrane usher protein [Scandinavium sp.]HEX4502924.1 fimbria/pilus outer membrane usher protein [Scandinavium sp.]